MRSKMRNLLERANLGFFHKWQKAVPSFEMTEIIESKSGNPSLRCKIGEDFLLMESSYNPEEEANIIADSLDDIKSGYMIFFGIGLGYTLDALSKKYPSLKFIVYEPSEEVLYRFFSDGVIANSTINNIIFADDDIDNVMQYSRMATNGLQENLSVFVSPFVLNNLKEEAKVFDEKFRLLYLEGINSLVNNIRFEESQIVENVKNLKYILDSPSVSYRSNQPFEGKPAIIVAAGPSLDEEMPLLKKIYEEKSAYIIASGSAARTLVFAGLHPHAASVFDSGRGTKYITQPIKKENYDDITLFFGDFAASESIEDYPGKLVSVPMVLGEVTRTMLKMTPEGPMMPQATTVSALVLFALMTLRMSPITFVGQNLGSVGDRSYAEGAVYNNREKYGEKSIVMIPSNDGGEIVSVSSYATMRDQIAEVLNFCLAYQKQNNIKNSEVFNSTRQGAKIPGIPYIPLEEFRERYLKPGEADKPFILEDEKIIDREYSKNILKNLKEGKEESEGLLKIFKSLIDELGDSKNALNLKVAFDKVDSMVRAITNQFYLRTVVLTAINSHLSILSVKRNNALNIKNFQERKDALYKAFGSFYNLLVTEYRITGPLFEEAIEMIDKRMEEEDV